MDFEMIKKIIKIAEEADISGLSVEKGDFKVEVKRGKEVIAAPMPAHAINAAPSHQIAHPAPQAAPDEEAGLVAITSPMVGTFYSSPSPDSPAYVKVGENIEKGKVVCIIEAMKLFNEIESEISGQVVKVLVDNAKPVEFGQKLMLIKKK